MYTWPIPMVRRRPPAPSPLRAELGNGTCIDRGTLRGVFETGRHSQDSLRLTGQTRYALVHGFTPSALFIMLSRGQAPRTYSPAAAAAVKHSSRSTEAMMSVCRRQQRPVQRRARRRLRRRMQRRLRP